MLPQIFHWFESRIDAYPDTEPTPPKSGLFPFIWSCLDGLRGWLLAVIILTAGIGVFEAYLFQMMGKLVDWLTTLSPNELWSQKRYALLLMFGLIAFSPLWIFAQSALRFQTVQGNFPMRLRWNFHRLMLQQSLSFYQDEFAGRVRGWRIRARQGRPVHRLQWHGGRGQLREEQDARLGHDLRPRDARRAGICPSRKGLSGIVLIAACALWLCASGTFNQSP